MKIINANMNPEQYYRVVYPKKNIVLHHTVGTTAKSAINWWASQPGRIGTAYVIDKDGTIYEAFPDVFWAHHLGLKTSDNTMLNRNSIGIELVNEGFLWNTAAGAKWFEQNGPIFTGNVYQDNERWRGSRSWAAYSQPQIDACCELVASLCQRFHLEPSVAEQGIFDPNTPYKHTIYAHHNVRIDKTDVSPAFPYRTLNDFLTNKLITV